MSVQSEAANTTEHRGEVLDVLGVLLAEGKSDAIVEMVAQLVRRNGDLERRLAELLAKKGRKNERVSTAQLLLLLDGLAEPEEPSQQEADDALRKASGIDDKSNEASHERKTKPKRQPPMRRPLPEDLRRLENPLNVPTDRRACPKCGKQRTCIGHDVTEVVELIPAEVVVRVDKQEKLACKDCEGQLCRAPRGDKVVLGGRMGPNLVGTVMVEKYRDGLPLHRQVERFARLGLDVSVSTLADQVKWVAELLQPLCREAERQCLAADVMHLDGTGLPVLDRQGDKGKRIGALWGYVGQTESEVPVALVLYASTGKKKGQHEQERGPEDILDKRKGYTVADASNLFDQSFKRKDLIECGCNMHARRYFVKALDGGDNRGSLPVSAFKKLYEIEAEIRDQPVDVRTAERHDKSQLVYGALLKWCQAYEPFEPPSSPLGKAIQYTQNHQEALQRFLDDGRIPIDNGIVERLHVRTALTRKNFLFAGSDAGGHRAAAAYTILGCCALADVDPVTYLADVLPRLARPIREDQVADLMPARWKALRDAERAKTAESDTS